MLRKWRQSLYLKLFLSFLAVCILFFIGLAVFWNVYFANLFFKDKKMLLDNRVADVERVVQLMQEGSFATRDLHISFRLVARFLNGEVWLTDPNGMILYSSIAEREGKPVPKALEDKVRAAARGESGFTTVRFPAAVVMGDYFLTRYSRVQQGGQTYVILLHTPINDINDAIKAVRWNIWVPLLFSLLAVAGILFTLSRRLAGPLSEMNRAALSLAEGDFTARVPVRSKDEIGQLAQSFNFMIEKLQKWEDTRQEFLTNVSHELRSPLTALRGLITAMNDGVIPQEQAPRYLKICDHEVQRLQRLVTDLLDLARIQNNADVFRPSRIDAVAKARETIDVIAPMMKDKGLDFQVWIPDDSQERLYVWLDPDRYAQILHNLLSNAIQFTPEGRDIRVRLEREENDFVLRVRDSGIGMSEEEKKRVWERFFKANPSRGVSSEGTGLGLTIVWHLVTVMNGRINVQSEVGQGSEFIVCFPLANPHSNDQLQLE